MTEALLELRDLAGGYEPVQIFQGIDLTIPEGASVGLFGPNGHGSGLAQPETVRDLRPPGNRLERRVCRNRWMNHEDSWIDGLSGHILTPVRSTTHNSTACRQANSIRRR